MLKSTGIERSLPGVSGFAGFAKKAAALVGIAAVLLAGCATKQPQRMNDLRLSMSKAEVIKTMGMQPTSTSATADSERLIFSLVTLKGMYGEPWERKDYFVQLRNGVVEG